MRPPLLALVLTLAPPTLAHVAPPDRLRAVFGPSLMMFNGAHSGDPVPGAGPHENRLRMVPVNVRGNAALVVTEETGRNNFREWTDEQVG